MCRAITLIMLCATLGYCVPTYVVAEKDYPDHVMERDRQAAQAATPSTRGKAWVLEQVHKTESDSAGTHAQEWRCDGHFCKPKTEAIDVDRQDGNDG